MASGRLHLWVKELEPLGVFHSGFAHKGEKFAVGQGALVAMSPDGAIALGTSEV